jgi:hypothetical protein
VTGDELEPYTVRPAAPVPQGAQPDWVMFGWRRNGRCRLMASRTILNAHMQYVRQQHTFRDVADMMANFRPVAKLDATIRDYVIVEAATFTDCLAAILYGDKPWNPDDPERPRP